MMGEPESERWELEVEPESEVCDGRAGVGKTGAGVGAGVGETKNCRQSRGIGSRVSELIGSRASGVGESGMGMMVIQ